MKVVPLKKQSKKEQRKYHARLRRDCYDRKKLQKPSANDGE